MRARRIALLCLGLLALAPLAHGQYVFTKILSEGDPAIGVPGTIDNVSKPNVTTNGMIAFRADTDAATDDDVIYIGTTVVAASGNPAPGTGGSFNVLPLFAGAHHANSSGTVVYTSTLTGTLPTAERAIHAGNTLIFQMGAPAPGIAGRTFFNFLWPGILNDGRIGFRADLDTAGGTTDNEVIYFDGMPLPMNGSTIFREGTTIVGGPLAGEVWDSTAFNLIDWNNNGDMIVDGDLFGPTISDDVLVLKPIASNYTLELRQGDMMSALIGGMTPFEGINEVKLNDSTEWAIRGFLETIDAQDSVAVVRLGGGAPTIIAQEGASAAAATGVPGTVFGNINGVSINNLGHVAVHANVTGGGVIYDEAVFLYSFGTLNMIFTDQISMPTGLLTDIRSAHVTLADDGSVVFEGVVNNLEGIYKADPPAVFPPLNIMCDHVAGTGDVALTWDIPMGQTYTGVRVFVNGVAQVPDLPGTATSFTAPSSAFDEIVEFTVVGLDGMDQSPDAICTTAVPAIPDLLGCNAPAAPILDLQPVTDTITITAAPSDAIREVYVEVRATHPFIGDLDPVTITSPSGTTVTLMSSNGATQNAVRTFFSDDGAPLNTVPYSADGFIRPSGPGSMADFFCEDPDGIWTLGITDDDFGDEGTLDEWCIGITNQASPTLDCCDQPTGLVCTSAGTCGGGGVVLSWTNNATYFSLELVRDDRMGGVVTLPLAASATSFQDTTAVGGTTYDYRLQFVCQSGGATNSSPACAVEVDADVPPVADLVCVPDFCTQEVAISWSTQSVPYDLLVLQRNGVDLATVTGMTSFVDTAPFFGPSTYTIVASCLMNTAAADCMVDLSFEAPSDLFCQSDLMSGNVNLTWTNNGSYDSISILRNGMLALPGPLPGDSSWTDPSPLPGCNTYELLANCGGSSGSISCSLASFDPMEDYLMIPESTGNTVGLYDPNCGGYVGDLITPATIFPMGFESPVNAVYNAADDRIYLSDQVADRVMRFERDGTFVDIFADSSDGLDNIRGLQFDASGNLLVCDNDFVGVFDSAGNALPDLIFDGSDPVDILPITGGNYAVSNIANPDDVRSYLSTGASFTQIFPVDFPLQLHELTSGNLVVTSFNEDSITEFTPMGVVMSIPTEEEPRGVHELTNGFLLYTTSNGVWTVDPLSGTSTQIRGGINGRFIELLPGDTGPVGPEFLRGDCNADAATNIADAVRVLNVLFPQGCTPGVNCPTFDCADACDANDDGANNIADAVFILNVLFPVGCTPGVNCPVFPDPGAMCGVDPTMDTIDCAMFGPCP